MRLSAVWKYLRIVCCLLIINTLNDLVNDFVSKCVLFLLRLTLMYTLCVRSFKRVRDFSWLIAWVNNDNSTMCKMDLFSVFRLFYRSCLFFQLNSLSSIPLRCQLPPGIGNTMYNVQYLKSTTIFLWHFMQRSKLINPIADEPFFQNVTLYQNVHTPNAPLHLHK